MKMRRRAGELLLASRPCGWPSYRHVELSAAENVGNMVLRSEWPER